MRGSCWARHEPHFDLGGKQGVMRWTLEERYGVVLLGALCIWGASSVVLGCGCGVCREGVLGGRGGSKEVGWWWWVWVWAACDGGYQACASIEKGH